jgi:uncharacterized membrane protein
MTVAKRHRYRRFLKPVRMIRVRPRLFASVVVGLVIVAACPAAWRLVTRVLVGWDAGVLLYLALVYHLIAVSHVGHIRLHAKIEDEGRFAILVLTAIAALASLGAILAELGSSASAGSVRPPVHVVMAIGTIVLSWTFTHTIFALHYAYEFYEQDGGRGGGLAFSGDEPPDYWDFVYFSFVIGMTSQVSDVTISCKPIRRTVLAHGVVAFAFNAALLALTINLAASVI